MTWLSNFKFWTFIILFSEVSKNYIEKLILFTFIGRKKSKNPENKNIQDRIGDVALTTAIDNDNLEIAKVLIDNGSDFVDKVKEIMPEHFNENGEFVL